MSRRSFKFARNDTPDGRSIMYEVVAGWDQPLGRLHLAVFQLGENGADVSTVWSSLRMPAPWVLTVRLVMDIVMGFVETVPYSWVEALVRDAAEKTGNDRTDHTPAPKGAA